MSDLVLFDSSIGLVLLEGVYTSLDNELVIDVGIDPSTWHPTAHLPKGLILTRDTETALRSFWAAEGGRVLTDDEIAAIVGYGYDEPVLKREFGTGKYPVKTGVI